MGLGVDAANFADVDHGMNGSEESRDRPGRCDGGTPAGTGNRQVSGGSPPLFSPDPVPDPVDGMYVSGLVNRITGLERIEGNLGCKLAVTRTVSCLRGSAYTSRAASLV